MINDKLAGTNESEVAGDDNGYKVVAKRRRPKQKPMVGTGTGSESNNGGQMGEFKAANQKSEEDKKIWLFISRAKQEVTEDTVRNYIANKSKTDITHVDVKLLKTRTKKADNNCFLIGVKQILKDEVYREDFWPKGIHYQRFNFRIGQHFLEKNQTTQM